MHDSLDRVVVASAELGVFGSAVTVLRVCRHAGPKAVQKVIRDGRSFPLLDALIRDGATLDRIARRLDDLVAELDRYIGEEIAHIVCTALEADLIDRLADTYPDRKLTVVRHDPAADVQRVPANYDGKFQLVEEREIDLVADPFKTVLVVPVFDAGSGPLLTCYPNTFRILGDDSLGKFADVVAIDLLGAPFHFFPADLIQISIKRFTGVVHFPVIGDRASKILEAVA